MNIINYKIELAGVQEEPLISILIPVYNKEKYLEWFIYLLRNQTYKNLEFLFVDDGSNDSSSDIIRQYQNEDNRITLIEQENQGVARARNVAVNNAKADLITFIDPDDFIVLNYIETLVFLLQKYKADMSCVNNIEGSGKDFKENLANMPYVNVSVMDAEAALNEMCYFRKGCGLCLWGKLFSKTLFKKHPCPEYLKRGEDVSVCHLIVAECNTIVCCDAKSYYYVKRDDSIIHKSSNYDEQMVSFDISNKISEYLKNKYPSILDAVDYFSFSMINTQAVSLRATFNKDNYNNFKMLKHEIKRYYSSIMRNNEIPLIVKVNATSIKMGYVPYYLIHKLADIKRKVYK